jgi:hypothetical protein
MNGRRQSNVTRAAGAVPLRLRFVNAQSGSIAVEFGYLLPVVLVILLGLVEVAFAISNQLMVQGAARAGTQLGMSKPPVQGDVQPIVASVRAALPPSWVANESEDVADIQAEVICECEYTGNVACGQPCGSGERSQSFLRVNVSKRHYSLVKFRNWTPSIVLSNSSVVRLN